MLMVESSLLWPCSSPAKYTQSYLLYQNQELDVRRDFDYVWICTAVIMLNPTLGSRSLIATKIDTVPKLWRYCADYIILPGQ
jgi:hypothetical protein